MSSIKHLPVDQWPAVDREAFRSAYAPRDVFADEASPGAHLADGTRRHIEMSYRRWLGFLHQYHPEDMDLPPDCRITLTRVRTFVEDLATTNRPASIATIIDKIYASARLIAPSKDWSWLKRIVRRLDAQAMPMDRFARLVPSWATLDLGIEMMETADVHPQAHHRARELQYRNGLIIALLSLWPIRRRSLAALTVSGHLKIDDDGITLLLHPEDTKAKRAEAFRLPEPLVPYMRHYLTAIRPRLLRSCDHDGLWASYQGRPLSDSQIYSMVRKTMIAHFGKDMGLHDFRRAAATFLATEAPDQIGLIPGVLQHTSPEVSEKHYNLARATEASRRHGAMITDQRTALRSHHTHPTR